MHVEVFKVLFKFKMSSIYICVWYFWTQKGIVYIFYEGTESFTTIVFICSCIVNKGIDDIFMVQCTTHDYFSVINE